MSGQSFKILGLLMLPIFLGGCASFNQKLKSFLGGKPAPQQTSANTSTNQMLKYSDNPDVLTGPRRQYKRMTREKMADESLVHSNAGSLWVMEGQGAYLFSQNIVRMIGDPIGVIIEGEPKEQLQAKVEVISSLLKKLEMRQQARQRALAAQENESAKKGKDKSEKSAAADVAQEVKNQAPDEPTPFSVKSVPTRVVERTVDGNYRIKGGQPFMIGSREYKIIVTGVVRAEDFNDEGISAAKLLDPRFDIVSTRKKEPES